MPCEGQHFFKNALSISGGNHTVHNVVKNLKEAMSHFDEFFAQFKIIELALGHQGRKERIVAVCLPGTPFRIKGPYMLKFNATLHEPRWDAIRVFCQMTIGHVGILRRTWCQEKYEANGRGILVEKTWAGESGPRFKPAELTAVLKCSLFRFYHHMVLQLHNVPAKLAAWLDGCPCHEQLLMEAATSHYRKKALKRDGCPGGTCVCMSCNGWRIVDGKLDQVPQQSELVRCNAQT